MTQKISQQNPHLPAQVLLTRAKILTDYQKESPICFNFPGFSLAYTNIIDSTMYVNRHYSLWMTLKWYRKPLYNDVPIYSITRAIEIDLLEMLDEKDIPIPYPTENNFLM